MWPAQLCVRGDVYALQETKKSVKLVATSLLMLLILVGQLCANEIITFGSGENSFSMEFVKVGAPGNRPDTDPRIEYPTGPNGSGAVPYEYSIAKFEVSCEQMKAVARDNGLPSLPAELAENICQDPRSTYGDTNGVGKAFTNWLNEQKGYEPAYISSFMRNPNARFALANGDEWYKAAYYDPANDTYYDYATGSDTVPSYTSGGRDPGTAVIYRQPNLNFLRDVELAGGESPFGTVGQTGNIGEVEESNRFYFAGVLDSRFAAWESRQREFTGVHGFRVVMIPEPSCGVLSFAFVVMLTFRWRQS